MHFSLTALGDSLDQEHVISMCVCVYVCVWGVGGGGGEYAFLWFGHAPEDILWLLLGIGVYDLRHCFAYICLCIR